MWQGPPWRALDTVWRRSELDSDLVGEPPAFRDGRNLCSPQSKTRLVALAVDGAVEFQDLLEGWAVGGTHRVGDEAGCEPSA